jgi:hypothetical protein
MTVGISCLIIVALDAQMENVAVRLGLTKEQWHRLLYLHFTAGDSSELAKVDRAHLEKVHGMASRLLEVDEQKLVFALIDAVDKHLSKTHLNIT